MAPVPARSQLRPAEREVEGTQTMRRQRKNGKLTSSELDRIRLEVLLQSLQRTDLSLLREIREMMREVDGFVHLLLLLLLEILLFLERHDCYEVSCAVSPLESRV